MMGQLNSTRTTPTSRRRCGGQGDVLAGAVATFLAWGSSSGEVMAAVLADVAAEEAAAGRRTGGAEEAGVTHAAAAVAAAEGGSSLAALSSRDTACVTSAAALGGCAVTRLAAARAFAKHKRSMVTTDIIPELGPVMEELFPVSTTADAPS